MKSRIQQFIGRISALFKMVNEKTAKTKAVAFSIIKT